MSLFQKSVLKSYLYQQDQGVIEQAYERFKTYFLDPVKQDNIKKSKEEQYQEGFLRELFVDVLGYTINPNPNFNLITEQQNTTDQKKADAAILVNGVIKAVIELKGTNTIDLNKVQDQAFRYYNNHQEAVYIITSNFEKIRFYIQKTNEYEEFNLFTLSYDDFVLLYLCLHYNNIATGLPLKIKQESVVKENDITKSLYKDYSRFKKDLFNDLCAQNQHIDKLVLFKASQKLIDRFLFIFFCEDNNGLLPANSIAEIIKHWNNLREMDEYRPLYEIYRKYFEYINKGRPGSNNRAEIFAYNGGLFSEDTLLDNLRISDTVLYTHTQKLSSYDFVSEVDVNILGHIFEHSLNEIEELQAEIEGESIDKTKTKRKKDGVFYTPRYITEYIVENTVGKLCNDKKEELGIIEDDFVRASSKKERSALYQKLESYKTYLLSLTICDPACGSGAFLNQAFIFLQKEHQYIADLESKLFDTPMVLTDVSADILENNLYGVDINEESVEIARLSLWLRSARRGRKLNNLSSNIKCGNSLIDDPEVAGDKAFSWEREFSHVFVKGGFDVVIGNPPYVSANNMNYDERQFYNNSTRYEYLRGKWDLYIPFFEVSLKLVKDKGFLSFIIPYGILNQPFGENLRKYILDYHQIISIVDLQDVKVFNEATVPTCILTIKKNKEANYYVDISRLKNARIEVAYSMSIEKFHISEQFMFRTENLSYIESILKKIKNSKNLKMLDDILYISTGAEIHGKESRDENGKLTSGHSKFDVLFKDYSEGFKEYIEGSAIPKHKLGRYFTPKRDYYLNYSPNKMRSPKFPKLFESKKIIVRGSSGDLGILATLDENKFYTPHKITIGIKLSDYFESKNEVEEPEISLEYILAIINSRLYNFYYKSVYGGFIDVYPNNLKKLPIKVIDDSSQKTFIALVNTLLLSNRNFFETIESFQSMVQRRFNAHSSIIVKLNEWYKLDFNDFVKELYKKKIRISLNEEAEWDKFFSQEKKKAIEFLTLFQNTDKKIDQKVYELYGLSEEEIRIVENNL